MLSRRKRLATLNFSPLFLWILFVVSGLLAYLEAADTNQPSPGSNGLTNEVAVKPLAPTNLPFAKLPALVRVTSTIDDKNFAMLDMKRIFDFFVRSQNYMEAIERTKSASQLEVTRRVKKIEQLKARREEEAKSLATDTDGLIKKRLDNLNEEIDFLESELSSFLIEKKNDLVTQENLISKNLLRNIYEQTKRIAQAEKYYIVIDRSEQIRFLQPKFDITEKVIRALDRESLNLKAP